MPIEDLQNIDWVKSHLWEVYKAYKLIWEQLDAIKNEVKSARVDRQYWDANCKYNSYVKLRPVDINVIMERYPVADNPTIYNISLSKEAQHVITDESLFTTETVESVRIELPQ